MKWIKIATEKNPTESKWIWENLGFTQFFI